MASTVARLFVRLFRSRGGNVAMIMGLLTPALVGFAGLGTETAYWYFRERSLQAAADITAYDGALALRNGLTEDAIAAAANTDAVKNGWRSAIGTIAVNTPPVSGTHQNAQSVEVVLAENEPRYFTALFASGTLMLESETTPLAPARLEPLGARRARLSISEGRYHQVRRMFAATGNHVEALHRSAIGGLVLDHLPAGEWRALGADEVASIFASPGIPA